ncbi:hypothetical protein MMC07_003021 [Pseudocyphellaria aurata]|nr:hypothetical protein [Pseudocyphellaria aurata]
MRLENQSSLNERNFLTEQLQESPYNAHTYLRRANCYERLGFPDLAVGDAYRALLLTDEVQDESGEYHEQAVEAFEQAWQSFRICAEHDEGHTDTEDCLPVNGEGPIANSDGQHSTKTQEEHTDELSYDSITRDCAYNAFLILTRTLLKCGCLNSAYDFARRGLMAFPDRQQIKELQKQIVGKHQQNKLQQDPAWDLSSFDPKTDLPEQGSVRRELYPWNEHEPDRFSESSLQFLNGEMRKVAPKCEVRSVSLPLLHESALPIHSIEPSTVPPAIKQLGIFATEDIASHETVLHESSLLTANIRLYDPLCDACSSPLPSISPESLSLSSCPSCDDTVFCSENCHVAAQTRYHPTVCGKADFDIVAKDPSPSAAANALYLLLLARAVALSETQDIHPLDLPETKYLWGDFTPPDMAYAHSTSATEFSASRHLPFTFHDNVLAPLHLLEKMDMDIFAALPRCDTWVLNTLFAKFRATASARLSTRDGKPEVCAVHPMWCLANHSCAPNVRWEWGGEIRFEARGDEDVQGWKEMGGQGRRWGKGIGRGEEVLNHYCDVGLGVRERREWAIGALGGICVCERCIWEESQVSSHEQLLS